MFLPAARHLVPPRSRHVILFAVVLDGGVESATVQFFVKALCVLLRLLTSFL
jgi:hypothetical protein